VIIKKKLQRYHQSTNKQEAETYMDDIVLGLGDDVGGDANNVVVVVDLAGV